MVNKFLHEQWKLVLFIITITHAYHCTHDVITNLVLMKINYYIAIHLT